MNRTEDRFGRWGKGIEEEEEEDGLEEKEKESIV